MHVAPRLLSSTRRMQRPLVAALTLLLVPLLASLSGCATRTVRHSLIKRNNLEVDLVREVKGFSVQERGFEHPAVVAPARLGHILGALEIEAPAEKGGTIRQPAFHPEIVPRTAEALSDALERAGPDEAVGMKVLRKELRLGLFHTKYLTSFLAYMQDGHLYLLLRRVEWPVPRAKEDDPLPEPRAEQRSMPFRVVTADPIYFAGVQDLEIDWKSPAFAEPFRMPGSTSGERRRREVIMQSPVPRAEQGEGAADELGVGDLTPAQLRALADLEEERREGRITESAYQRARRQLLRKR